MTIIAKKVSPPDTVENVHLSDCPTDYVELIQALGGDPGESDFVPIGCVGPWEILLCTSSDVLLVVGKDPVIGEDSRRESCDLNEAQVWNVIKSASVVLQSVPSRVLHRYPKHLLDH